MNASGKYMILYNPTTGLYFYYDPRSKQYFPYLPQTQQIQNAPQAQPFIQPSHQQNASNRLQQSTRHESSRISPCRVQLQPQDQSQQPSTGHREAQHHPHAHPRQNIQKQAKATPSSASQKVQHRTLPHPDTSAKSSAAQKDVVLQRQGVVKPSDHHSQERKQSHSRHSKNRHGSRSRLSSKTDDGKPCKTMHKDDEQTNRQKLKLSRGVQETETSNSVSRGSPKNRERVESNALSNGEFINDTNDAMKTESSPKPGPHKKTRSNSHKISNLESRDLQAAVPSRSKSQYCFESQPVPNCHKENCIPSVPTGAKGSSVSGASTKDDDNINSVDDSDDLKNATNMTKYTNDSSPSVKDTSVDILQHEEPSSYACIDAFRIRAFCIAVGPRNLSKGPANLDKGCMIGSLCSKTQIQGPRCKTHGPANIAVGPAVAPNGPMGIKAKTTVLSKGPNVNVTGPIVNINGPNRSLCCSRIVVKGPSYNYSTHEHSTLAVGPKQTARGPTCSVFSKHLLTEVVEQKMHVQAVVA